MLDGYLLSEIKYEVLQMLVELTDFFDGPWR